MKQKILDQIGGDQKLRLIVAQFYQNALNDDRFNYFWLQNVSDIPKLHETVTLYLIGKFGGENNYKGPDMKSLHKNMKIQQKHYRIFWQHLLNAFRQFNVEQNIIQQIKFIINGQKSDIVNTPD